MNETIPDTDTVVRYCGLQVLQNGRVQPKAFEVRSNEKYVSVNWKEIACRGCNEVEQLTAIRKSLKRKMDLGTQAVLAELNVGEAKRAISQYCPGNILSIRHIPTDILINRTQA